MSVYSESYYPPPMYRGVSVYYPFCVFRLISLNFGEVPVAKNTKPENNGGRNIDFLVRNPKIEEKIWSPKSRFFGQFSIFFRFFEKIYIRAIKNKYFYTKNRCKNKGRKSIYCLFRWNRQTHRQTNTQNCSNYIMDIMD